MASILNPQTDYIPVSKTRLGERQMQAKIALELLAIDREKGRRIMSGWERFAIQGSGSKTLMDFANLDEYIPYRSEDVAWR